MKELLEKLITVYNKTHKGQLFIKNDILFHADSLSKTISFFMRISQDSPFH